MNSREQIMAVALIGLIFLVGAGGGGYFLVYDPIVQASANEEALDKEIAELEKQVEVQRQATQRLTVARTRSLPADKKLAEREYAIALRQLMDDASVPKDSQVNLKTVDNSPRAGVPEISKGKPIYTRIAYEIVIKKADMWMIKDFLQAYYQLGLLHQITAFNIKKDEDGGAKNTGKRNDLTVTLTTEAIIVDGAEARKTLLPVPTAFAAVGGGGMYSALRVTPAAARAVRPEVKVPTLSPVNRDYSLIVQKDPFNGPLPPPEKIKPIRIATIRDVEIRSGDEKPSPVRFAISGDGANTATVTAIAAGSLIPEGALKVDSKGYTIELPAVEASEGTSTVTVVATTADGKSTDKTTFKVSVKLSEKPPTTEGEDIAAYIVLIGTTPRSDGTAWARVKDNANRLRYEIEAKPKGVTVVKEWFVLEWKKDRDYEEAPGILHITAEGARTNRTFKVIAVDADGLIVSDLKPAGSAPAAPKGKGGGPKGLSATPKQGHASAMAALGGNRITAVSKPKLYRWEVGEPLTKLREIPEEEAKVILKSAEANGPVFDVAAMPK